jgi:hypothetical protein
LGYNIGATTIRRAREPSYDNVAEELAYLEWTDPAISVHSKTIEAHIN